MKTFAAALATLTLSAVSVPAFAQVGTVDTYCGLPVFDGVNDLDPDAPFVGALKVNFSTNANVQKVIAKFGKHTLAFGYEDSPHLRRIAGEVSAHFQNNHAATEVCIDASALVLSRWGTPVEAYPIRVLP